MFNSNEGRLIGKIKNRANKKKERLIYVKENKRGGTSNVVTKTGKIVPLPDVDKREVVYIAGPSGSGKSTYAATYIKNYLTLFPDKDFFIFSRTNADDDPAFSKLTYSQVTIDNNLVENPIDITQELTEGCIILFDDVNTVQDPKLKKAIDNLMNDIMECGRKLGIYCVITNHLVIPNERKMARTVLNECTSLTVFPKSGGSQQITYALKTYFGYTPKQIAKILKLPSRWVTLYKTYPQVIMTENEAYVP